MATSDNLPVEGELSKPFRITREETGERIADFDTEQEMNEYFQKHRRLDQRWKFWNGRTALPQPQFSAPKKGK